MTTSLDVAVDAAWFRGHFPGRPILPAVSQIALVLDALARHRGEPVALGGIGFARMRQPVVPGDPLRLDIDERAGGVLRFTLVRDGAVVTNGELRLDQDATIPSPRQDPSDGPAVDSAVPVEPLLLPHRRPMRFVESVLGESADGMTCAARIPADCALVAHGTAPAVAAIEAAAQTAAVWEATRRRRDGGSGAPRLGYLVGLRDVAFFARDIPADQSFQATVRLEAGTMALMHYAMQVDLGPTLILRGTLATYLTDETMPA